MAGVAEAATAPADTADATTDYTAPKAAPTTTPSVNDANQISFCALVRWASAFGFNGLTST
jgi:hypothetical protein